MNNIPKGYKLVPVSRELIEAIAYFDKGHRTIGEIQLWAKDMLMRHENPISDTPVPPQPIYDESKELGSCRASWDRTNVDVVFADYWQGWRACAKSRANKSQ